MNNSDLSPGDVLELVALRRDLHRHPETAFDAHRTAALVAGHLRDWGLEVHTGLARTGVVGILHRGNGPAIGLRSDMDALDMQETGDHPPPLCPVGQKCMPVATNEAEELIYSNE